jgi:energy-coupling factor transporter transmembrane protein EcfT
LSKTGWAGAVSLLGDPTPAPRTEQAVTPPGARRLWDAPAVRAVLIQALAAPPTLGGAYLLARCGHPLPPYGAALLQGALAALLTAWARLDPWWLPIQLLFPIALLGAHGLRLAPPVLLGVFLFMLLLFWSTFRTQVPFYPSGPLVWRAVETLLPPQGPVRLIDIGSGLGGLVLNLARRHPAWELSGIELAPLPWLCSVLRARATGSAAQFIRGDYERLNFADYEVVFAYLSPAAMGALWRKASQEMRPATMLVSFEFRIAAKAPDRTVSTGPSGPPIYVWYF